MVFSSKRLNVACLGGGTGMPMALLPGLKNNPWLRLSAIVTMFDSGGSSGTLRDSFNILPPGDILKCFLALAKNSVFASEILLKRINHTVFPGHNAGNLLLKVFEEMYGSYESALDALGQILSIQGQIAPVSIFSSTLCADCICPNTDQLVVATKEVEVDCMLQRGFGISRLFLDPPVDAYPQAINAIKQADIICIGPGSFYTSVMPNFLPVGIVDAVRDSSAPLFFICNLVTEGSGMKDCNPLTYASILEDIIGRRIFGIIANNALPSEAAIQKYSQEGKSLILPGEFSDARIVSAPLWKSDSLVARHDPELLGPLLFALMQQA